MSWGYTEIKTKYDIDNILNIINNIIKNNKEKYNHDTFLEIINNIIYISCEGDCTGHTDEIKQKINHINEIEIITDITYKSSWPYEYESFYYYKNNDHIINYNCNHDLKGLKNKDIYILLEKDIIKSQGFIIDSIEEMIKDIKKYISYHSSVGNGIEYEIFEYTLDDVFNFIDNIGIDNYDDLIKKSLNNIKKDIENSFWTFNSINDYIINDFKDDANNFDGILNNWNCPCCYEEHRFYECEYCGMDENGMEINSGHTCDSGFFIRSSFLSENLEKIYIIQSKGDWLVFKR
jgi:hypothetical protein